MFMRFPWCHGGIGWNAITYSLLVSSQWVKCLEAQGVYQSLYNVGTARPLQSGPAQRVPPVALHPGSRHCEVGICVQTLEQNVEALASDLLILQP